MEMMMVEVDNQNAGVRTVTKYVKVHINLADLKWQNEDIFIHWIQGCIWVNTEKVHFPCRIVSKIQSTAILISIIIIVLSFF